MTIKNCYNIGKITGSQSEYQSGIVCIVYSAKNTLSFSNNYFLSTCGGRTEVYDGSASVYKTIGGISSKTETELKALTSTLGSNYKNDTKNINRGYPILSWQ